MLRNCIKPTDKSGIRTLKEPVKDEQGNIAKDDNGKEIWKILNDPQQIEKTLIDRNITHFGQAHNTPFTSDDVTRIFGQDGHSHNTEELLQGSIPDIDHLPIKVQLILKKIASSPQPTFDPEISTNKLKETYKNWKESTSTSPSGCHLGHWHALMAPDGTKPTNQGSDETIGTKIMNIHANTLNASSILSGIPLDRWTTVHSNMISKIEGVPQVDKLRVIHLYEADYNGYLKKEWPNRAVRHTTERHILNNSQGGGVKKEGRLTTSPYRKIRSITTQGSGDKI
jgi:hypothetical protein